MLFSGLLPLTGGRGIIGIFGLKTLILALFGPIYWENFSVIFRFLDVWRFIWLYDMYTWWRGWGVEWILSMFLLSTFKVSALKLFAGPILSIPYQHFLSEICWRQTNWQNSWNWGIWNQDVKGIASPTTWSQYTSHDDGDGYQEPVTTFPSPPAIPVDLCPC